MTLPTPPSRARWALLAGAVYLLLVVVWAPARALGWILPRVTDGAVHLVAAEGSLWQGSGEVRITLPNAPHYTSLGVWSWRWDAPAALGGELAIALRARGSERWGRVTWHAGGTEFADLQAELPAAMLTVLPALAGYRPEGRLEIDVPRLSVSADGRLRGQGRVRWHDAALAAIAAEAMGDSLLEFSGRDGQTMAFRMRPLRGPVEVSARGEWLQSAAVTASGEIALADGGGPWKAWLDSVARRVDDHRYRFAFDLRTEGGLAPTAGRRHPDRVARHP